MTDLEIETRLAELERINRDVFRGYEQHAPNPTFAVAREDWEAFKAGSEVTLRALPMFDTVVKWDIPKGATICFHGPHK